MIITIVSSDLQILAGIPQSIALFTDVPSLISYTLDGSPATVNSSIYISPIVLPTDVGQSITINIFATNGVDTATLVQEYFTTLLGARRPRSTITNYDTVVNNSGNLFPYGDQNSNVPAEYGSVGGITVDDQTLPVIPDGYDGTATNTSPGGTNLPLIDYDIRYSETDSEGRVGHGIGTLPATVNVLAPQAPPESSSMSSRFFNPRSLVIYQDSREEQIEGTSPQLMRDYFTMENSEKVKTGALLFNTAMDGLTVSGSLIRREVNVREQTITSYYRDSGTNQWIISTNAYTPNPNIDNYSQIVFNTRPGMQKIFKWIPFKSSRLI